MALAASPSGVEATAKSLNLPVVSRVKKEKEVISVSSEPEDLLSAVLALLTYDNVSRTSIAIIVGDLTGKCSVDLKLVEISVLL